MGTELALTGGHLNTPSASDVLTTPLWRALINGDDTLAIVKAAAESQVVYRDALAALPHLEALAAPAGERGAIEAVAKLKLLWPPKDVPAEETAARAWWVIYRQALADIPRSALDLAVAEYIRTSEYSVFPIPGKLRALAEPHTRKLARMVARTRMVTKQPAPKAPISDAERAAVKAQMDDLTKTLGAQSAMPGDTRMRPAHEKHKMADGLRARANELDAEKAAEGEAPAA